MLVSVCVATCQRPEGLRRLLNGLNLLSFRKIVAPNLEVVVVDNDATGSAKAVCTSQAEHFQWSLKYCIEETRGISYARNKAIASVNPKTDFVVTIDDDEVSTEFWLDELLFLQQMHNADIVTGPVLPHFVMPNVPQWVVKGKFFEPQRYPTGHTIHMASTNNVLIRFEILQKLDPIFDERFAFSGGEDVYLFMRLHREGYKLIWADEALVYEWIPESRTRMGWVLERGFLGWGRHSFCEKELYPSLVLQTIRILKGLGLIVRGLCFMLPSLFLGKHTFIRALLNIYQGLGTLAGLLGIRYEVYRAIQSI
ncbi:glycosyltransferase [Scytonema sp. UIC 10036]|uniref:glycosyltransferase family 2 protein n=1 Tax=Scytonema sp. UIC 10036 TaxID=2304196 RepID=UPI0012DA5AC0|nr:glycosyltransferase [Scytonema sp. UIC 10036]MUG96872.1 glycosyltransferase [Scytonema sp. UIC 10036]